MRIGRLLLGRYGHLTDAELMFPSDRGLHIVLGGNEAGKSTALAAILDALFGFGHRTPYAFLHATADLRVAITLRDGSGRDMTFVRRKANKNNLLDETGAPIAESALAAWLGGVTRERFAHGFGLDAAGLRAGGEAILKGEGDIGESILQAHTGLSGFRALAERLNDDAGKLFGDRRGQRAFHLAAETLANAKRNLAERTVDGAGYVRARGEYDEGVERQKRNAEESRQLAAERSRLQRIRATAPARMALAAAEAALLALGDVPALPADAEDRRQKYIVARETAADSLRRERERDAAAVAALDELVIDAALLDNASAIDALTADRNRIAAAEADRQKRRIVAEQHTRAVQDAGQRLGLSGDAASLVARIPDALSREAAERAVTAHVRLSERMAQARAQSEAAAQEDQAAQAALAAAGSPPPAAALRAAIDAVKTEGRIDATRAAAVQAAHAADAELARALEALPLWQGDAAALAAAAMPLDAAVTHAAKALTDATEMLRTHGSTLQAHDAALAEIAADLRALTAGGDLPTEEAIAAARKSRDTTWNTLRRVAVAGDLEPPEGGLAMLADRFTFLLHKADALADRQASDAGRVERFRQLTEQDSKRRDQRAATAALHLTAETAHAEALAAWRAVWQPAGIVPDDPTAMREWRQRRDDVLAKHRAATQAADALAALNVRCDAAWSLLAGHLPAETAAAAGSVAGLLRAAELACAEREAAIKAHGDALTRATAAHAAAGKAARTLDSVTQERAAWRTEWEDAARRIHLPPQETPEGGKHALKLWAALEGHAVEWREACDRIDEMTAAIDDFAAKTTTLVDRIAPDLLAIEPQEASRRLAARLADARATETTRLSLVADRAALRVSVAKAQQEVETAAAALSALHKLAGTTDDTTLAGVIARAAQHADVSRQIAARHAELQRLGDGRSLDALTQEAAGIDTDTLPARIADIDDRLAEINADNIAIASRLTELRAALKDMEAGHDAAGAAQAMQDSLAAIDDIATRYVRLRLAHTLLRAGIDRFRRQQQDPLLGRAGMIFARLTEGRYDRLDADEDEHGRPSIRVLRPDGSACPVERLSEGTRDQLFLALRLAAIESAGGAVPFIADDLLVNFDDRRARAALRVLGEFAARTQTILFTHHAHIAQLADRQLASVQDFAAVPMVAG